MMQYSSGVTFCYIASQIKPTNKSDIICVKDGYELVVYNSKAKLPEGLTRINKKINSDVKTVEFHWRSDISKSEYVFFEEDVDEYLKVKESENMVKVFLLERRRTPRLNVITEFRS